jgi:hypothetical protein
VPMDLCLERLGVHTGLRMLTGTQDIATRPRVRGRRPVDEAITDAGRGFSTPESRASVATAELGRCSTIACPTPQGAMPTELLNNAPQFSAIWRLATPSDIARARRFPSSALTRSLRKQSWTTPSYRMICRSRGSPSIHTYKDRRTFPSVRTKMSSGGQLHSNVDMRGQKRLRYHDRRERAVP